MILMELTGTNGVFSRITMVLFMCRSKRSQNDLKLHADTFQKIRKIPAKDEGQGAHTLLTRVGRPPRACPPISWDPWMPSDANSNSIYLLSERKKSERRNHHVL